MCCTHSESHTTTQPVQPTFQKKNHRVTHTTPHPLSQRTHCNTHCTNNLHWNTHWNNKPHSNSTVTHTVTRPTTHALQHTPGKTIVLQRLCEIHRNTPFHTPTATRTAQTNLTATRMCDTLPTNIANRGMSLQHLTQCNKHPGHHILNTHSNQKYNCITHWIKKTQ